MRRCRLRVGVCNLEFRGSVARVAHNYASRERVVSYCECVDVRTTM